MFSFSFLCCQCSCSAPCPTHAWFLLVIITDDPDSLIMTWSLFETMLVERGSGIIHDLFYSNSKVSSRAALPFTRLWFSFRHIFLCLSCCFWLSSCISVNQRKYFHFHFTQPLIYCIVWVWPLKSTFCLWLMWRWTVRIS